MHFVPIAQILYLLVGLLVAACAGAAVQERSTSELEERLKEIDAELDELARYSLRSGYGTTGWRSIVGDAPGHTEWVQIDLGQDTRFDQVVLVPAIIRHAQFGYQAEGFPLEFRVLAGKQGDPNGWVIGGGGASDALLPRSAPVIIPLRPTTAGWIRLEATTLSPRSWDEKYLLQLSEILVFNGQENIALHRPVQVSSGSEDLSYNRQFLVDGFMPYLMDAAQGAQSSAFLASVTEGSSPSFVIDLGRPQAIDRMQLHAMDVGDHVPQALPSDLGIPKRLVVEVANRADFSDAKHLLEYQKRSVYDTGPVISRRFEKTVCRYVKLTAFEPFILTPDRRASARIGFAEIELFADGRNVALNRPVLSDAPETTHRKLSALTDGRNQFGNILSTRVWLEQLARRHQLEAERPWIEDELSRRYLQHKTNLNRMVWLSVLLAVGIAITILVNRILRMRQAANLRERFAADLHDELGANIHTMGILNDMALNAVDTTDQLQTVLERNHELIKRTSTAVRHCMNLQGAHGSFGNLPEDIQRSATRILAGVESKITVEGEAFLEQLQPGTRAGLRLFFKECLVNVSRHADATKVTTQLRATRKELLLTVRDNGQGISEIGEDAIPASLRRRARLLGAKVYCSQDQGDGTCITLKLKMPWLRRIQNACFGRFRSST